MIDTWWERLPEVGAWARRETRRIESLHEAIDDLQKAIEQNREWIRDAEKHIEDRARVLYSEDEIKEARMTPVD